MRIQCKGWKVPSYPLLNTVYDTVYQGYKGTNNSKKYQLNEIIPDKDRIGPTFDRHFPDALIRKHDVNIDYLTYLTI